MTLTHSGSKLWINSSPRVLQEEEVAQEGEAVQDEELQEEDQQVIETWTRNIKACTCDCESADSPTRVPSVIPPVLPPSLPPPPPPQGHLLNCMPGEDSTRGHMTYIDL